MVQRSGLRAHEQHLLIAPVPITQSLGRRGVGCRSRRRAVQSPNRRVARTVPNANPIDSTARDRLGIELTELQSRALDSTVGGRDTLVVSPTGSGKSAIYQLAGSLLEGTTIVVSPLI